MPRVRNQIVVDSWYEAKKDLSLGTVSFKAGKRRFIPASVLISSRYTFNAFVSALAAGLLARDTPSITEAVIAEEPAVITAPPPPVIEEPVVIAEPPIVESPPVAAEESVVKRLKRRRK